MAMPSASATATTRPDISYTSFRIPPVSCEVKDSGQTYGLWTDLGSR
jgi:hypothetical protein